MSKLRKYAEDRAAHDPEFRAAYEAEIAVMALVRARKDRGLSQTDMANRLHVSLAEGVTPSGAQHLDGSEAIEIVRLPIAEAVEIALSGGMIQAMHVGLLMIGLKAAGR